MSTGDEKTYTNKDYMSLLNYTMSNNNRGTFFNPAHVQKVNINDDSCTVYPTNLMFHSPQTFKQFEQMEDFVRCAMLAQSFERSTN